MLYDVSNMLLEIRLQHSDHNIVQYSFSVSFSSNKRHLKHICKLNVFSNRSTTGHNLCIFTELVSRQRYLFPSPFRPSLEFMLNTSQHALREVTPKPKAGVTRSHNHETKC
jgi:hypothetical protein